MWTEESFARESFSWLTASLQMKTVGNQSKYETFLLVNLFKQYLREFSWTYWSEVMVDKSVDHDKMWLIC